MLRFFGFLFLLALGVGAWGWWQDWFSFETSEHDGKSSYTVNVDKDEFARDLETYEQKVHAALEAINHKIAGLRDRARTASAKSKPELEEQIRELEQKKGDVESLRDLRNTPPDELPAKKKKIDEALRTDGDR